MTQYCRICRKESAMITAEFVPMTPKVASSSLVARATNRLKSQGSPNKEASLFSFRAESRAPKGLPRKMNGIIR
jgi:hypothetical protein